MSPESRQPDGSLAAHSGLFLQAQPEGVLVVVWKKPPTVKGLDDALAPAIARFKQSPGATQAVLIVSLATSPAPLEANRYAATLAKTYAKQVKPLAMVEDSRRSRSLANRIAIRMILATAGVFGIGPTVGFFSSPEEASDWIANKLREYGTPINASALRRAVAEMVERCSARPGSEG